MPYKNPEEGRRKARENYYRNREQRLNQVKDRCKILKREAMMMFGGVCTYPDCDKNVNENLDELHLSHPNEDGDKHRTLLGGMKSGCPFYHALKSRNWNTDGFVIVVMCKHHHASLDTKHEGNPSWKGNDVSVGGKYIRHQRHPNLYPSLTVDEREEYNNRQREDYRRKKNTILSCRGTLVPSE